MKHIIILVIILVTSCASSDIHIKDINGVYVINTTGIDGRIVLNKNHEFLYNYNVGLIKTVSKGKWKVTDNYLFLDSYVDYINNTIDVKEIKSINERFIKIVDEDGLDCVHAVIQFDEDKEFFQVDQTAKFSIPFNKKFSSFTIHYIGESYKYVPKEKGLISFNVKVYLSDLSKTYFNSEKLKIKNKSLINSDGLKFVKKQ